MFLNPLDERSAKFRLMHRRVRLTPGVKLRLALRSYRGPVGRDTSSTLRRAAHHVSTERVPNGVWVPQSPVQRMVQPIEESNLVSTTRRVSERVILLLN